MTQATAILAPVETSEDVDHAAVAEAVRLAVEAERDRVFARLVPLAIRAGHCESFEACLRYVYVESDNGDPEALRRRLIVPGTGRDRYGYDLDGFSADGLDRNGYNRDGLRGFYDYDNPGPDGRPVLRYVNREGWDTDGYDLRGFDRDGYNRRGIDRNGYNRDGLRERIDRDGVRRMFGQDGYTPDGYDIDGYDRDGYNRDGFNYYGWNRDLVHRDGYRRGSAEHRALFRYDRDGNRWRPEWEVTP